MSGVLTYIQRNLDQVRANIVAAAIRRKRDPNSVRLVAVTKSVGLEEIKALYDLGVRDFGENRVPEAQSKISFLGRSDVTWHMIGTLQSRKARDAVRWFDTIDAVDRLSIAEEIQKQALRQDKIVRVLLEVNVSGEQTKHGFAPNELAEVVKKVSIFSHIRVQGLMTMAPLELNSEKVRPFFARLRELASELNLHELSMGMSNDYEVAVEEGATEVRIGSALFEPHDK